MKPSRRFIVWVICCILLGVSVLAGCPEDPGCTWDAEDTSSFNYAEGDFNDVDWNNVDWSKIPNERIHEVPAEQLDYGQLNSRQRLEMTSQQISQNFNSIEDLTTDVDMYEAVKAIKEKYKVDVTLGGSATIKEGVFSATFGKEEHVTLEGSQSDYSRGSLEIKDDGSIIFKPAPGILVKILIPSSDSVTVDTQDDTVVYQGNYVSGILSFQEGQAYVKTSESVTIGGYSEYTINGEGNPVNIYFDSKVKPQGNYVLFSEEDFSLGTVKGGKVSLKAKGSPSLGMVFRDYATDKEGYIIPDNYKNTEDKRATFEMVVADGDKLQMTSREKEGKTPLFSHQEGGGSLQISTGRLETSIKKGKLEITPPKALPLKGEMDMSNSVAFELVSDTKKMKNTVLRTSSSNRFSLLRNNKEVAGTDMGLEVSNSWETNMMKTQWDLIAKYPQSFSMIDYPEWYTKEFGGAEWYQKFPTANAIQSVNQWLRDKHGAEKYFAGFVFIPDRAAFADPNVDPPKIYLGERALDPITMLKHPVRNLEPLDVLDHEFRHTVDMFIETKEYNLIGDNEDYKKEYIQLVKKYAGEDITKPDHPFDEEHIKLSEKHYSLMVAESNTLGSLYRKELFRISSDLYKKKKFKSLLAELKPELSKDPEKIDEALATDDASKRTALVGLLEPRKLRRENSRASKRFEKYLKKETGLSSYAFSTLANDEYNEVSTVSNERSLRDAKKNGRLTQLEYDAMVSADSPPWLLEEAEKKYYDEMGGKNGAYCKTNPCGPCLAYTLTCKVK